MYCTVGMHPPSSGMWRNLSSTIFKSTFSVIFCFNYESQSRLSAYFKHTSEISYELKCGTKIVSEEEKNGSKTQTIVALNGKY